MELELEQPTSNSQRPYLKRAIRLARKATLTTPHHTTVSE